MQVATQNIAVPKLRFNSFKENWVLYQNKSISSKIGSGSTPRGGDKVYTKEGVLFIRSQNVVGNRLDLTNSKYISLDINQKMKGSIVKPKDVLLNITGASIGRSCVVPENFKLGNLNQHVCIIRLIDKVSPYFYQPLLTSHIGQKQIFQGQSGSGREGLNFQTIASFKFYLPSIQEQEKIASFLSSVDDRIHKLERKKSLLEDYKKGVMQKIFSKELRFKDDNGNNFPDWEEKTLGDIGEFKTSSVDKKIIASEEMIYLVNYMNVYNHESITNASRNKLMRVSAKANQISSSDLKKGDVLFTPSSETPDDIGRSVVIFEDLEKTLYSYHLMRFRPKIKLDILYSHYFCNTQSVLKQITKYATGSTRFTISVASFSKIKISIPPYHEQQKIASFLSGIDKKIELVGTQIQQSKTFKKGLLQQMFV